MAKKKATRKSPRKSPRRGAKRSPRRGAKRSPRRRSPQRSPQSSLGFPTVDGWDFNGDGRVTPMPKGGRREPLMPAKLVPEDYARERLIKMYKALPFKEFEADIRKLRMLPAATKYTKAFADAYAWLLPGVKEGQEGTLSAADYKRFLRYLDEEDRQPETTKHVIHLLTRIHEALKSK